MNETYKEYFYSGIMMSIIALMGSLLSIVNLIPLLIAYQCIQKARVYELPQSKYKILSGIFQTAIMLTLLLTIFYLSFQW